ncbi:MAG: MFS transporter, partial [Coriobacteriaceae bacterium]|nr:MFS transporter [Coriobacteriaceae bacterium]
MEERQPLTIRHVLVVATGILCLFGPAALSINTWSVFLVPVTQSLGISSGDFTFYVTLLFLAAAASSPIAGNLMQKVDLRIVISAAAALCSIGIFLCQFYTEAWQFYVSGVLQGMGICVILFLTPSTLVSRWFNVHNGLLIGICAAMSGAGAVVWTMLAGFIIDSSGWREAYLVFGIACAAISLPATLFCIRSYPEDIGLKPYGPPRDDLPTASVGGEGAPERPGIAAKDAFRMPVFYTLMITFMLTNATAQLGNYLPTYLYHLADLGQAGLTAATVVIMASV